jgi:hypothetical protein
MDNIGARRNDALDLVAQAREISRKYAGSYPVHGRILTGNVVLLIAAASIRLPRGRK